MAAFVNPGGACVHLISVRGGRVLGSKNFFPQVGIEEEVAEVMAAFLSQYYLGNAERELPGELIVNVTHEDFAAISEAVQTLRGRELAISHRVRGTRARWQQLAVTNAEQALNARLANRQHMAARFEALAQCWASMKCPSAWNATTSAIPAVKPPWPVAWCSARKDRSSPTIDASTSKA